ncbi:MAG: hypothetical protein IT244_00780, partial [Bacteroidia bacterium]|nr:hypothetical protein [Bacteroidia bacterium]
MHLKCKPMIKNNTPKYIGIFLFIFLASTPNAHSQMGGSNYTIDSSAAATATNFKTWFSFWRSLQGQSRNDGGSTLGGGISSSVTVLVKSDLTDTNIVKFPFISGTSSTKTITINGNGKYFACSKAGEIFSFQGGDYISIKNLTIRHLGSNPAAAICLRLYNNSDNNTIQNCTLEFANLSTASTDGSAYVAFCASANTLNTTTTIVTGTNNIIKGNLCRTTNTNSPGPAFAFVMNGTNTGYTTNAQNNTFDSNTVQNFYATAVQALYGNGNQFIYNNISRANASIKNCNSTLLGFNMEHSYSGSRSFKISNNIFHDIPYVGAGPSTGVSFLSGITASENHGSSTYPFDIKANNFNKLYSTDDINMAYLRNSDYLKITQNVLDKMQGYNTVGSCILWDISTGDEIDFSNNTVTNCELMGKNSSVVYIDNFTAASSGYTTANNNTFQNNNFFYECNVFYANYSNWKIKGNKVLNNTITGKNGGYMFCILLEEFESAEITNNLVANNIGEDGIYGIVGSSFNSTATNCDVHQNTIYLDGTTITSGAYDINGLFLTPYFQTDISVSGNIIALKEGNSGSIIGVDAASSG